MAGKPQDPSAADATPSPTTDRDLIRELAQALDESNLTEIEIERTGFRLRIARNVTIAAAPLAGAPQMVASAPTPSPSTAAAVTDYSKHPGAVPSPMVGTAYLQPEPEASPFVKLGDPVTEGQTILIIEAMKTMNQIAAPRAGRVKRILVTDGQPVEFGAPLFILE